MHGQGKKHYKIASQHLPSSSSSTKRTAPININDDIVHPSPKRLSVTFDIPNINTSITEPISEFKDAVVVISDEEDEGFNNFNNDEEGEVQDTHTSSEVPKVPTPTRPAPIIAVTGFLDKLQVINYDDVAKCNPSLFYNSPRNIPKLSTPERRERSRKKAMDRYMQRCTHNDGNMDEGGFLEVPPQYKPELRYTHLIPRYMRTMIYFQSMQSDFMKEMLRT
jgi:hypothetical protein